VRTTIEESLDKDSHGNGEVVRKEHGKTIMRNTCVAEGEERKANRKSEHIRRTNQILKEFVW